MLYVHTYIPTGTTYLLLLPFGLGLWSTCGEFQEYKSVPVGIKAPILKNHSDVVYQLGELQRSHCELRRVPVNRRCGYVPHVVNVAAAMRAGRIHATPPPTASTASKH